MNVENEEAKEELKLEGSLAALQEAEEKAGALKEEAKRKAEEIIRGAKRNADDVLEQGEEEAKNAKDRIYREGSKFVEKEESSILNKAREEGKRIKKAAHSKVAGTAGKIESKFFEVK